VERAWLVTHMSDRAILRQSEELGDLLTIDQEQVRAFIHRQGEQWNSGAHDEFIAGYRAIAPGGFHMEYPVGQPVKSGWQVLEQLWADYQGKMTVSYPVIAMADNGEFAVVEKVDVVVDGVTHSHHGVHAYVLRDGELLVRYFSESPAPSAAAQATKAFLAHQYDRWNESDRGGFFDAYDSFAGDRFDVEFPIGTSPNPGRATLEHLWQGYQHTTRLRYQLIVVTDSNDGAVWVRNEREVDGRPHVNNSIEFYSVRDDGLHIRYFHEGH
jgi:hypothetical protein